MKIYIAGVAILLIGSASANTWLFGSDAFDESQKNMKAFFSEQRDRVQQAFATSYENARKLKDSVDDYVSEQHKKINDDINTYVENIKESGRKVIDTWSYLPNVDDPASKMENPDMSLSVPSIISRHGYPCETHTIVSKGYVLNVHRINKSKGGSVSAKTVYLQHGLFASSADWILNGPEKSLAYVLADAGYDVWMGNIRGNRYSREHVSLKTDSKAYWNFSWHDVALYDVPAIIDYIIKMKGNETKVTYIGHSMGTTILFAMLTLRPEYNHILTAGFALAPVVYMSHMQSSMKSLAPIASNIAYTEMLYGSHEFIPKKSALGKFTASCDVDRLDFKVCKNIVFSVCGYDDKQLNKHLLPVFLNHLGTGTSWKTVMHFTQHITTGKFQQFDYGTYHNQKVYSTDTPPEYNLNKITLPISLFYAENDYLSSVKDVQKLYNKLPSETTEMHLIPFPEFNHLDYLWAIDAPSLLNKKLLDSLEKVFNKDQIIFEFRIAK